VGAQLVTARAVFSVLRRIAATADRSELARILSQGRAVNQADANGSGTIERIEPDGAQTIGRLEHQRFCSVPPVPSPRSTITNVRRTSIQTAFAGYRDSSSLLDGTAPAKPHL
jgi:hypothetical protein